MKKTLFISLVVVLFVSISSLASANLLTNTGFETGDFSGWSQWNDTNAAINDWGRTGNYSAAAWWDASGWQTVSIADPNALVTIGGYIYDDVAGDATLTGGTYAELRVEFKDISDTVIGTHSTGYFTGADLTDNAWNSYITQVTPSSYGSGIVKATAVWEVKNTGTGSGRGIFDDLIVEPTPIPEPASLILLSSGIMGLIPFCYKRKNKQ